MLHLQKASAGSGKTYTLTRNYIRLMIGISEDGKPFRLRRPEEIPEAHSHILAVTFTNKATNEMKQRFIQNLSALAFWTPGQTPNYMQDFVKEFGCTEEDIQRVSSLALTEILNNYTDFQVSTIDSFFQTILRSFAYESELADNYRLEIDDQYVTRLGLDTTFSRIKDGKAGRDALWWVKCIMNGMASSGSKWNILQKSGGSRDAVFRFVSQIEKEGFRAIRDDLEKYFSRIPDLRKTMEKNRKEALAELDAELDRVRRELDAILSLCREKGAEGELSKNFSAKAMAFSGAKLKDLPQITFKPGQDKNGNYNALKLAGWKLIGEESGRLNAMFAQFYSDADALSRKAFLFNEFYTALPYVGLMKEVLAQIAVLREENNIVQLSDTNTMINKIVGDDITPFIYEKIGYYIHHYLIDEFQDTSDMQWENFRPLLAESHSYGRENLIIGDAKQSIYRFRGADSSIITSKVPETFDVVLHGESKAENTNYRSSADIVRFNNTLFSFLTEECASLEGGEKLKELYSGVVQYPANCDIPGYVELTFTGDEDSETGHVTPVGGDYSSVARKVAELVTRGYRMGDIGVLVRTNEEGKNVIDAFVEYNRTAPVSAPMIEFMSEESLKITRAKSVNIIVSALRLAVLGTNPGKELSEDGGRTDTAAESFNCDFNWYAAENPSADATEILKKYLAGEIHTTSIEDMLRSMQSVALPALVENITGHFISPDLRREEAPYIAAFQDTVLDYCETYTADPASFLRWWDMNGASVTVSTPEGTDAVNVMTIHKSKGLEFACVIIPGIDMDVMARGRKSEYEWVRPDPPFDRFFPPYMPLKITKDLIGTEYESYYRNLSALILSDAMNTFYVGCTRAARELYITLPVKEKSRLSAYVREAALRMGTLPESYPDSGKAEWLIDSAKLDLVESKATVMNGRTRKQEEVTEKIILRYGSPVAPASAHNEDDVPEAAEIREYYVNPDMSMLKYKEADDVLYDEDDDPDPRSDGNIRHAVMASLSVWPKVETELDRALRRMEMRGYITSDTAAALKPEIMAVVNTPEAAGWFAPGLKVYNERPLVKGHRVLRPDRFMVTPGGDVTVVDYKFGRNRKKSYVRQVKEYMDVIIRTGKFRSVKGFIWYVSLGEIEEVK